MMPDSFKVSELAQPLALHGPCQHYAWGKVGHDSLVARLSSGNIDPKPYAELWVGAHPSNSARLRCDDRDYSLAELVAAFPTEILGAQVAHEYGELPFLFKILSIGSPLSLQAHPDKLLAQKLHQCCPAQYPDSNHKPELAIAISPVELLYGFQSVASIEQNLAQRPELRAVVGSAAMAAFLQAVASKDQAAALRLLYVALMQADADLVRTQCRQLFESLAAQSKLSTADQWVLRLQDHYPQGEVGLFSFYLMNLVRLAPGEALEIGPNVLHAYLGGDLAECMANSDNVVRAGLTPKFTDVATLTAMLSYSSDPAVFIPAKQGKLGDFSLSEYPTPFAEFSVSVIKGSRGAETLSGNGAPQIIFCLEGEGELGTGALPLLLKPGSAILVSAAAGSFELSLKADTTLFKISVPL